MAATLDKGFNVPVDAEPVDGEAGSCLGVSNSLLSIMKVAEQCGIKVAKQCGMKACRA